MTNLMNDLRQASAEVSGVKMLSPAAQAVLDAVLQKSNLSPTVLVAAVALRAAADQVVPEFWHEDNDIYGETMQDVRQNLLAIAAELEGADD